MSFKAEDVTFTEVDELPEELGKDKDKKPKKKRRKPSYSKTKYGKLPPVKVLNKGITDAINNTVLSTKKEKLKKDDCEVGEAVMYMIEYYTAIDINHPALVMMSAVMGLTFVTMELMQKEDDPKAQKEKAGTDIDIKASDMK